MNTGDLTSRSRASWTLAMRRLTLGLIWAVCAAFLLPAPAQSPQSGSDASPMRLGFTRGLFKNQNEADIIAAMKVWAATLSKERGFPIDTDMPVYRSPGEAEEALRNKEIDALTLLLDEYAPLPPGLASGPFFRIASAGRTHEEFVVLARKDRDVGTLQDLREARLAIHDSSYSGLASAWLDAQLADEGLAATDDLCSAVEADERLSAVVLGVFFGKHDACLVSRDGFLAMVELNPQIGHQLRIVEASSPIIPTLFCFRMGVASDQKRRLLTEVLRLHESLAGEQVLRVFKADRMATLPDDEIDESLTLLRGWQSAVPETRIAPLRKP